MPESWKNKQIPETLIKISVFLPIAGAIISAITTYFEMSASVIFAAVVYLYMAFLSAYLWSRDLEYGLLEEIEFIKKSIFNDRNAEGIGIDEWYNTYSNKIRDADERIWITQNSELSPERDGREEYKIAFDDLEKKGKTSQVNIHWMILPASEKKIEWLLGVIKELYSQDNIKIAVLEVEKNIRNNSFPLIQSLQLIDNRVFGIDMWYGRRRNEERGRIGSSDHHFYSENPVFRKQSLRYLRSWWSKSTIISDGKDIRISCLFSVVLRYSETPESRREDLDNVLNKMLDDEHYGLEKNDIEQSLEIVIEDKLNADMSLSGLISLILDWTKNPELMMNKLDKKLIELVDSEMDLEQEDIHQSVEEVLQDRENEEREALLVLDKIETAGGRDDLFEQFME